MTTQRPLRNAPSTTLRDWVDAMPIVILVRALASAFGDRAPSGRRAAAQPA